MGKIVGYVKVVILGVARCNAKVWSVASSSGISALRDTGIHTPIYESLSGGVMPASS